MDPIGEVTPPAGSFVIPIGDGNLAVGRLLTLALSLVVVAAVIFLIYAGFKYINAQGDQKNIQAAQSIVTNTLIGLAIAFISYVLVQALLNSLGFGAALTDF